MKYLALVVLLSFTIPAYADDCTDQCTNKYVNLDAQVVCKQVCEVKETLQVIANELHKQTELLKEVKK